MSAKLASSSSSSNSQPSSGNVSINNEFGLGNEAQIIVDDPEGGEGGGSGEMTQTQQQQQQQQPSSTTSSWLHQVKGRIAKTVEEKYTEYKHDRELKRQALSKANAANTDEPFEELNFDESADGAGLSQSLPHSFSDDQLIAGNNIERPPSTDNMTLNSRRTSTPVTDELVVKSGDHSAPQTPKERRRFTFGFLDRSPKPAPITTETSATATTTASSASSSIASTPSTATAPAQQQQQPPPPPPVGTTTPTKSLRSRMMGLMGKSPAPSNNGASSSPMPIQEPKVSVRMQDVRGSSSASPMGEDPFTGLDLNLSSSAEKSSTLIGVGGGDTLGLHDMSDVETAMEAHEELTFEGSGDDIDDGGQDTITGANRRRLRQDVDAEIIQGPPGGVNRGGDDLGSLGFQEAMKTYWVWAGLPVCFLLFLQLLPLPAWVIGFVTGILIGIPTAVYATWSFCSDGTTRTPFIENVQRKEVSRPAIIVQEELKRIYVSRH